MSKYDVTIAHVIHTEIVNFRIVPFFNINFKRAIQGEMKPEKKFAISYIWAEIRHFNLDKFVLQSKISLNLSVSLSCHHYHLI